MASNSSFVGDEERQQRHQEDLRNQRLEESAANHRRADLKAQTEAEKERANTRFTAGRAAEFEANACLTLAQARELNAHSQIKEYVSTFLYYLLVTTLMASFLGFLARIRPYFFNRARTLS